MAVNNERSREIRGEKPRNNANVKYDSGGVPEGAELRQELSHASELTHQLDCSHSGLPHLTQASFIWPETEDQYAMKEELEEELSCEVNKLIRYMPVLESRIRRYRQNLGRIEAGSTKLNREEPFEHFAEAQEAQRKQYLEAVHDKDSASIVLAEAQAVLNVSRKKTFPGGQPVRQFPFPGAKPGDVPRGPQASCPPTPADTLGEDVDGLISLGPLGRTENSRE